MARAAVHDIGEVRVRWNQTVDLGVFIGMADDPLYSAELQDLYGSAYPRLVGLLTVATGHREDAEEIAQEAFLRLIPRWDRVGRYDDPEAWLRTVALRVLSNRRRRTRHALQQPSYPEPDPGVPDSSTALDVARHVTRLPLGQREVVLLHYVYDLTVVDVARTLGVRVGTVKSRLARARVSLAEALKNQEVDLDVRSRH